MEKGIEMYLNKKVREAGGLSLKLACTGIAGTPDRLILGNKGEVGFVECKAQGQKPRKLQVKMIDRLKKMGHKAFVVDSYESVDKCMKEVLDCGV